VELCASRQAGYDKGVYNGVKMYVEEQWQKWKLRRVEVRGGVVGGVVAGRGLGAGDGAITEVCRYSCGTRDCVGE